MRGKRKISLLLAACMLCAACLTGCGSASIAERREDDSSTLYVGSVGTSFPTSFMPWLSREGIAPTVASMIYNTLFSYNPDSGEYNSVLGKRWCYVDLEGQPLTEDGTVNTGNDFSKIEKYYTESTEDYAVVRVELNEGIKWTDGKPLTVEDVYYSFDVATDYPLSNHAGALVWTADLKHKSDGGELVTQGMFTAEHPDYSGTFAINPGEEDTVMYLLINKTYDAVTTLFNTILILPKHIWEPMVTPTQQLNNKNPQGEFLKQYQHPVGSGAWILNTKETNAQMIVLDKNPDYHLKDEDGSDLFKVDQIKLLLYLDSNTAIFALRKGYIDILDAAVSSNFMNLLEQEEDIVVSEADGKSVTSLVLNLNPTKPYDEGMRLLLKDEQFRKALALAIDQEELIDKNLDGHGDPASAGLVLKTNETLYEPKSDILAGGQKEKIQKANEILDGMYPDKDKEGYRMTDGERITFEILAPTAGQDLVSFLQRQFQKIGIDVKFKAQGSTPETTYLYSGNFDIAIQSVILSMFNAGVMYKSHFVTTERSSNYGKLYDEEIAQKVEDMRSTLNQDTKVELIKELQVMVAEEYYKIPLYTTQVLSAARTDRFKGYVESTGSTFFNGETLRNLEKVTEEQR